MKFCASYDIGPPSIAWLTASQHHGVLPGRRRAPQRRGSAPAGARLRERSCPRDSCSVPAERISGQGFRVHNTHPIAVSFHSDTRVIRLQLDFLAFHRQVLADLVRYDGDVVAQAANAYSFQGELVEVVLRSFKHLRKRTSAQFANALRTHYDARIISETCCDLNVLILNCGPVTALVREQLLLQCGMFFHMQSPSDGSLCKITDC